MPSYNTLSETVDPYAQVPLIDRVGTAGRALLGQAEHVAGELVVTAGEAAAAVAAELVDLGVLACMAGAAYRLTTRGVAVWSFVARS